MSSCLERTAFSSQHGMRFDSWLFLRLGSGRGDSHGTTNITGSMVGSPKKQVNKTEKVKGYNLTTRGGRKLLTHQHFGF